MILFAAAVAVVIVAHELVAGPGRQRTAIQQAVPGFSCPSLVVELSKGSWDLESHRMRSALRMPGRCLDDLKRRIRLDPLFQPDRCNAVELCWKREDGGTSYTFIFYDGYTSFQYDRA